MAKKIVITSGKGGVGKTTVTACLGSALSSLGLRVALVDLDFGMNNLDVVMGVENKVVYDLYDVLNGRCRVKQALIQAETQKNLYILPSNRINVSTNLSGQNVKLVVENISPLFDYVSIDCQRVLIWGFIAQYLSRTRR